MSEKKTKTVQVTTTVTPELKDQLNKIRFAREIDKFSDVVRESLTEYVNKYGTVNSEGARKAR